MVNKKIAIEHNGIIVPKTNYKKRYLKTNDQVEIVLLLEADRLKKDILKVAGKSLRSRLIVGTGKYKIFPKLQKRQCVRR